MKKLFFPRRIPEPKAMEDVEMKVFEELSKQNYKRWIVPLVDDILEKIGVKEGVIADIGCGPGFLTKELASRSTRFRVVGIDISSVAVRMAQKNCKKLPNASFKIGNINKLPFRDGQFDAVACKDSFHHFPDSKRALSEMLRITKKGGLLYLQDMRRDLPFYLLRRSMPPKTVLQKLQYYSTRASYTKNELRELFKKFPLEHFSIKTRKVVDALKRRYAKQGINSIQLREGFQARYVAVALKN